MVLFKVYIFVVDRKYTMKHEAQRCKKRVWSVFNLLWNHCANWNQTW